MGLWTHNGVWKCLVHVEESVLLQVACGRPAHLCVATLESHRNKVYTVFSCDVVRWGVGGFVWGFRRGAGLWCEFRALTALGEKLLSSLAEWALILRYRLPEGRSWKRLWEGWVGSFLLHTFCFAGASCKENIQDGGERGTNYFCSGVHCPLEGLMVCCTTVPVPDSDAAGQHALNGTPVEGGEDGWREACSFQPAEKV